MAFLGAQFAAFFWRSVSCGGQTIVSDFRHSRVIRSNYRAISRIISGCLGKFCETSALFRQFTRFSTHAHHQSTLIVVFWQTLTRGELPPGALS